MMTDQVLIGLAGLVLLVLTYFAGVRRAEMRDRALRISRVLGAYMGFLHSQPPETSGRDGLVRAGIATLASNAEVQEVIDRIVAHSEKHPLGRDYERVFASVDLLRFFRFAADNGINFTRAEVQVQDVIRDSGARKG